VTRLVRSLTESCPATARWRFACSRNDSRVLQHARHFRGGARSHRRCSYRVAAAVSNPRAASASLEGCRLGRYPRSHSWGWVWSGCCAELWGVRVQPGRPSGKETGCDPAHLGFRRVRVRLRRRRRLALAVGVIAAFSPAEPRSVKEPEAREQPTGGRSRGGVTASQHHVICRQARHSFDRRRTPGSIRRHLAVDGSGTATVNQIGNRSLPND